MPAAPGAVPQRVDCERNVNRFKANLLANIAGTGSTALVQLLCVPLYVHFLGIESYALVGFFVTLQATLRILDLGVSPTMNREMARYSVAPEKVQEMRDFVRTAEAGYWAVGVACGALVCAAAPFISTHWIEAATLPAEDLRTAVMLMGGVVAAQWPFSFYQGGLMGLQRQVLVNVIRISGAILSGGGAVLVLWLLSDTISAFFVWQMIAGIAQVAAISVSLWRCLPRADRAARFDVAVVRRALGFAGGMSGIALAGVILTQMDKLILSKLLPLETFGYYVLAALVANSLQLFISPIYGAVFPRLSALAALEDGGAVSRLYHQGTQLMVVLVWPLALVVALFAVEILELWTGNASLSLQAASIVVFLTLGTALNGIMYMPYALQLAYGWTTVALRTTILMCVVMVPLLYLMAELFGAAGAAAVWLILNVLNLAIALPWTHRRLLEREAWEWLTRDVAMPLFASLAIVLLARELIVTDPSRTAQLVQLAAALGIAWTAAALSASRIRAWLVARLRAARATAAQF